MSAQKPYLDISATCACDAVHIAVQGTVRAMLLCACTQCQKTTGTGHAAVAIAERNDTIVTGDTRAFTRPAESGARFTRHFCPACATTIWAESSRWAGAALLPVGLFGGADWFRPTQTIFARSHLDWDILPDIPAHRTYRDS